MAKILVLVSGDDTKIEEVLEKFVEIGIRGATIIDSVGMGRFLSNNTSFFSGLSAMINGNSEANKTIFAVSKHDAKVAEAVSAVKEIMDDFKKPDSGFLFVIPDVEAYGFAKALEEEGR